MKHFLYGLLISTLLLLSLVVGSVNSYALEGYHFVGEWEVTQIVDKKKKKTYDSSRSIYFEFYEDGNLTITNVNQRIRTNWDWKVKGNKLTLISKSSPQKSVGSVKFATKNGRKIRKFAFTFYIYKKKWTGGRTKKTRHGPFVYTLEE